MRLFFAIELPAGVRSALARLRADSADYRWVDPAGMHVTLAFLGEQSADRLPTLERIGLDAATASRHGSLRLTDAGSFGSRRAPRVLWAGLNGDLEALRGLHARLTEALRAAQFAVEDREFSPHITLARRRATATGTAPTGWPPTIDAKSFPLNELTLFESRLSPRGATHVPLRNFPLGG